MTLVSAIAFALMLAGLALLPGPGVMLVISRTLGRGLMAGIFTILGIISGDLVFVLLAVLGLSALLQLMGGLFLVIKYLGAAYLIWLGIKLLSQQDSRSETRTSQTGPKSYGNDYALGLVTTLGNPKAILFYASIFPAFFQVRVLSTADILMLMVLVTVVIGVVLVGYAVLAAHSHKLALGKAGPWLRRWLPGTTLAGCGVWLAARPN